VIPSTVKARRPAATFGRGTHGVWLRQTRPRIDTIAWMTEDVSGLALECRVVSRARALTGWVGAGRPITAKGVLRRADVGDAARAIGVTAPAWVRTAADLSEMHHPWLVALAAGWLRIEGDVAMASSPAGGDPLTAWSAGFDAVLREESHDPGRRGARLACQAVVMALATNPPTPRDQLEETTHALLDHSQPGDITAVYQAFRRGIMPVDGALEVLADFGALDDAQQPTLTPLGRWAWQRLRPASADGISAAELLAALASLDEYEAAALAKQWFESRPLADACDQLLQLAATTAPAQRISVVDLIASLGEVTTPAWRAALAVPNLGAHAAAVLSQWGTGPKPTGRQEAWLATEYALATLARDGVEDAAYEVRDHGGLAALDAGAHPDLAVLRRAIDEFTGSGVRERVFQLKIALVGVRPAVWRRVLIPASATLGDLHRVIQVVLHWDNDLYRARTTRTVCELAFCGCRAGSGAWLFDCCT
jgi:hypothetical protein